MGRTVPTFREALEEEMERWKEFRRALREDDREAFDRMMGACKRLASAESQAKRSEPFQAMILAILLEHQRRLDSLERKIDEIQKKPEGD